MNFLCGQGNMLQSGHAPQHTPVFDKLSLSLQYFLTLVKKVNKPKIDPV